nr:probable carbohydrate esterase At4g34215 [Ipomoea trifida]
MEMNGKKKKWQMKNESAMALLTVLLLILYFWRTMIPAGEMIVEVKKKNEAKPKQIIVLAGQSNMAGRGGVVARMVDGERIRIWDGTVPPESHRNPAVYRFSQHFEWELAQEPLHQGIYCNKTCGVGIGMAFANRLLELDPDFGRYRLSLPDILDQDEDGDQERRNPPGCSLVSRRKRFQVLWLRKKLPEKPRDFVPQNAQRFAVIIPHPKPPFKGPFIEDVRKAQTEIEFPNVIKVDADGLPMGPDGIHLTTEGYVRLGTMLAESVFKNKSILLPNNNNITTVSSSKSNHTCGCP